MIESKQGVLLAFPRDDAKKLFAAKGDEALSEFLSEYLGQLKDDQVVGLRGQWHAVHAVLCDGDLAANGGSMPLNQVILGGRPLYSGADRIVRLVRPDLVGHAAIAMKELDDNDLKSTFDSVDLAELCQLSPADREATDSDTVRSLIQAIAEFYDQAAQQGAAVVFYADFSA
jgi:hypothetical protein